MSAWRDMWTGKTIGSALADATKRYASRVAIVFENRALTYQHLSEMSGLIARGLLALGVRRGDMIAIWMAGYVEWPYLYYGAARIGAIIVPLNTRYKPFEVEYVLNKSKTRTLVFRDEEERGKSYFSILNELSPELGSFPPGKLTANRLPHLRHVIAVSQKRYPGCSSFSELIGEGSRIPEEELARKEAEVQSEDIALLQFTSGTTALPKGALLYQAAMLRGSYYNNEGLGVSEGDYFFSPQPFYHVGGSIQVMLAPVVTGCTMVVQPYFDPAEALRLMEEYQCTATMGHQPHWIEYLNHPERRQRKLRIERAEVFAPPEVRRRIHDEMGIRVVISPYSLTETHLGGCVCGPNDSLEKTLTTVGRCVPGMEIGIRSPDDNRFLPQGETGEVCFRGWGIMKGYYDDPERTAEVIDVEGWLRTGDLGVLDPDGYVRLVGRIKDMIRVGGENVAASDVEGFLLQHRKIKQAVVVGAPDQRLGEVCVAFVELILGAEATEEEIVSYCKVGLASFKVPRKVRFVTEWPMSGTGKIQKFLLKESL